MNLSIAAAAIIAISSNVSPTAVLAGKAGKHASKSHKTTKAKAVKAHASLSYGSGSYSMSYGSPICPCWTPSDLKAVTRDNVQVQDETSSSCKILENELGLNLSIQYLIGDGDFSYYGFFGVDSDFGEFECDVDGDQPIPILSEQFEICKQQIKDRCSQVGTPVDNWIWKECIQSQFKFKLHRDRVVFRE